MISKCPTHPTTAGNRWGILAMCKILSQLGCDVHFLYIDERPILSDFSDNNEEYLQTKSFWGFNFHVCKVSRWQKMLKNIISKYRQYFCANHQGLYDEYPGGLTKTVKKLQNDYNFDICIINYIYLAKLFKYIHFKKKAIFTHDAFAYKNIAVNEPCPWYDAHQEALALQLCSDVFAVQDEEEHYFHILSPKSNLYNIYSKYEYCSQSIVGNKNILFLSGSNEYNQNGLRWFVNEVYPKIQHLHPDAKLLVAGGICGAVKDIENIPGVELKGFIGNPSDFYALGDVAINPTFQGTGLKIKTFESIANDKVTMVHPHSKAGVFRVNEAPLFSSDKPEEWVAFLDKIWSNKDMIRKIKDANKVYLANMNDFIIKEYKRFLQI